MTCFGEIYRIPRSEHGSIRQLEWEMKPDEVLAGMKTGNGQPVEHVEGGIIERFDVYDQESGDVWVMYRVPYPG